MIALWYHHSVIMADFLMPETQQPIIVIILIIYSSYFLQVLVELQEYNSARIICKLQATFFLLVSSAHSITHHVH